MLFNNTNMRTAMAYTNAVGDKVYPIIVDIKKGIKSTEEVSFVSSDINTGVLSVAFIQGNDTYNVEGAEVICSIMRPDTTTLEIPCNIINGNTIEVPLGVNGTSQDGVYSFDFKVFKGGNKIVGTPIMNYSVSLSIGNDMVVEEDDRLPVLTMLMTQVTTLKNETNNVISTANTAIQNANKATDNAKLAISNAQSATQKAEDAITRVNNAIASGTQDLEVKDARDGEVSLKARLDRDIEKTNKELDKIKKLEESTVSTVTTESDFTTVEATSNGYFEDVKLEGRTLVNCLNVEPNVYTTSLHKSEIVNGYHKLTMLTDGDLMWDLAKTNDLNLFKPSTYYTFIVDVKTNTTQSTETIRANTSLNCIFTNGGSSNSHIKFSELNQTGVFIYKYKSEPNFTINNVKLKMANAKSGGVLEYRMVILEGDHTQNPPNGYIEGLKSVGQSATTSEDSVDEIVVSSVKGDGNLIPTFDEFIVENNPNNSVVITNTKIEGIPSAGGFRVIKPIYFNKGSYTCSVDKYDGANARIRILTAGHSIKIANVINQSFTIDKSGLYIVSIENNGNTETSFSIEGLYIYKYGKQKPELYSYQSDKKRLLFYNNETQTWEKPILREGDSIEKHANGKYYYHQRSAEVVLNGSENTTISSANEGLLRFYIDKSDISVNGSVKSDRFNNILGTVSEESIYLHPTRNQIVIVINASKLPTQDVQGFKQWLQANNLTVVYQLAQEKVYECTNIDLITYANETNYIVDCGAIAPKSILKVHNNISNVVRILQEKVSLLENKFIEGLKKVLAGDMYSLAELLYPEDFTEGNPENEIMLIPFE